LETLFLHPKSGEVQVYTKAMGGFCNEQLGTISVIAVLGFQFMK